MSLTLSNEMEGDQGDGHPIAMETGTGAYLVAHRDSSAGEQYVELPPGHSFQFLHEFRPETARHTLIVGPSGVGKSTLASQIISTHPAQKIVISGDEQQDKALTNVDDRFAPTEDMADIPAEHFASPEGTIFIFDDVEGLPKAEEKALTAFRKNIYTRGRKHNVSTITIAHVAASGQTTKVALAEMTHVIIFPEAVTANTRYLLEKYCSLPRNFPELLRSWQGPIMVACNDTPQYIVGKNRACILNHDELSTASTQKLREKRRTADQPVEFFS